MSTIPPTITELNHVAIEMQPMECKQPSKKMGKSKILPETNLKPKNKQFIIRTKYGQFELTCERVISFLIMFFAITVLLLLTILSTGTLFLIAPTKDVVYKHATEIVMQMNIISTSSHLAMKTNVSNRFSSEVTSSKNIVKSSLAKVIIEIPLYSNTANLTKKLVVEVMTQAFSTYERSHSRLWDMILSNNKDFLYYENVFKPSLYNFTSSVDLAFRLADKAAINEDNYMSYTTVIDLILTVITLLVIIPTVIILFSRTAIKDNKFMEKLQKADAKVVIDTISDTRLQSKFKDLCNEHKQLRSYLFLEKVQTYVELCRVVNHLHDELIENHDLVKTISVELDGIEVKKFETAFEIITEYLDEESENYIGSGIIGGKKVIDKVKKIFDAQSMHLPEELFKTVQSNVASSLMHIHKLFVHKEKKLRDEKLKIRKHQLSVITPHTPRPTVPDK